MEKPGEKVIMVVSDLLHFSLAYVLVESQCVLEIRPLKNDISDVSSFRYYLKGVLQMWP